MSNDNNELKNSNEACEDKRELSMEELEQVSGGTPSGDSVSADSTTCLCKFGRDSYNAIDNSKPQSCGNCFFFAYKKGRCVAWASGC